jgi:hypothetical protein
VVALVVFLLLVWLLPSLSLAALLLLLPQLLRRRRGWLRGDSSGSSILGT